MHKRYSSKRVCLAILFLSTNVVTTLACTDTVVKQADDPSFGHEDGGDRGGSANQGDGVNEGGVQTQKDSQMDSAPNGCDGTDDQTCVPCTEHSDCSGTVCDKARGRCVPCLVEDNETIGCSDEKPVCAIGEDDSTENQCVECVTHDDCSEAACDVEQGRCVPCLIDDETTVGCVDEQPICKIADNSKDNQCVGCVKHSDCENGACDADENRCVPCLLEDDRSIGCDPNGDALVCMVEADASENGCVGCLKHDDCETGVCDLSRNTCVACLIEGERQIGCDDEDSPLCKVDDDDSKNNTCVACFELSDCNDPSASACSLETNQCTGCSEDSDCDGIEGLGACDDGQCVECTDSETHCSGSTPICHENECRLCEGHAECDFAGEVCNSETGACYQSDDVIYVDRKTCGTGADGSQERPFCLIDEALKSIDKFNITRIPILVRSGTYSSFTAEEEKRTWIIGKPGASVLGSREDPAIWVQHDSDMIIEGLQVLVLEGQKGIECKGEQSENPRLVLRDISVDLRDGEYAVHSISNCNLTLEESELIGIGDISMGVFLDACSASSEIKIVRNSIHGFGTNVAASNSLNTIIIEDNVISNGNAGVYIVTGPGSLILNRNRITGAKTIGVQLFNSYSEPMGNFEIDANIISLNLLGIQMLVGGTFQVTNNIIARNGKLEDEAEEEDVTVRGGVYVTTYQYNVETLFENIFHSNTVVYNQSSDSEGACGGVCSNDQNPLIVENSIIYHNTPLNLSDDVQTYYSIVGDNSGNQSDVSNPDDVLVPEFVSPDDNDFHLNPDSPGVDRGGSRITSHQPDTDIDGDPRFQGERLDIGADEVSP